MKLPIYLQIEEDTIWTEYQSQLKKVQTPTELTDFVNKWCEIYSIEIKLEENTLNDIRVEKMSDVIAELMLPVKILKSMLIQKQYEVPLNCAFIQSNGGIENFSHY